MEEVAAQGKDRNIARKRDENKIAELGVARRYPYEHAYSSFLLPLLSPLVLFRSLCFSLPLQPDLLRSYFTRDIYRTFLIRLLSSFQASSRPTSNSVRKLLCEQTMRNERSNVS